MKRELLSKALGDIDESFVVEAYRSGDAAGSPEMIVRMNRRRILTLAMAAVLLLALGASAYAVKTAVASPEAAQKVALQEIEVWKEMGLLSPDICFEGDADAIVEIEERTGSDYWYGRFFAHSYDVRWHLGPIDWGDQTPPEDLVRRKYGCNLRVDTLTGKITQAWIDTRPEEDDVPVGSVDVEFGDPEKPGTTLTKTLYFYDNFDDIFPADMTVDCFLTLLAEYWGFTGYRLADTVDEFYYNAHWSPVDADSLLKDMPSDNGSNYYLTVFFDGDQDGAPMYLQLTKFPGYVDFGFGTGHGVG